MFCKSCLLLVVLNFLPFAMQCLRQVCECLEYVLLVSQFVMDNISSTQLNEERVWLGWWPLMLFP